MVPGLRSHSGIFQNMLFDSPPAEAKSPCFHYHHTLARPLQAWYWCTPGGCGHIDRITCDPARTTQRRGGKSVFKYNTSCHKFILDRRHIVHGMPGLVIREDENDVRTRIAEPICRGGRFNIYIEYCGGMFNNGCRRIIGDCCIRRRARGENDCACIQQKDNARDSFHGFIFPPDPTPLQSCAWQ